MTNAIEAKVDGKKLIITLPLQKPATSKSGKTMIVATTHGNVETTATVDGLPVIIGVNAYIKPKQ